MGSVRASLAAAVVAGALSVCPTLAGEAPEQIIFQGKPIKLGAVVEATEWLSVREVKFRTGKFTVDGKPALVASGLLDSRWEMRGCATIIIHTYAWREDVRPRRLVPFALVRAGLDVTEPGKPTKFYAAGEIPPPPPGLKQPKLSAGLWYHACGLQVRPSLKPGNRRSTFPGENSDQIIHENRPISLGASIVQGNELLAAHDLIFRIGRLLDGNVALVALGQVEAKAPVGQRVSTTMHVYVPDDSGDPDRPFVQFGEDMKGSVDVAGANEPASLQAVGWLRSDARDAPPPKKIFYCVFHSSIR